MGGTKRVRIRFDDQNILSVIQKIEGLKRCWFLLNPDDLETIAALASHLVHKFELQSSCPNGVVLSMEGYVLPPFESTCILQDKDIIRVKRKRRVVPELIDAGDQEYRIGDNEAVEKQPALPGKGLLEIKEFEEESEGYTREHAEANRMSCNLSVKKKRKRSGKLHGATNRTKSTNLERDLTFSVESVDGAPVELNESSHQKKRRKVSKKTLQDDNSSNVNSGSEEEVTTEVEKKSDELEENGQQAENASDIHDKNKKFPSRSARRKKAKRIWLREQSSLQKKEVAANCVLMKDTHEKLHKHEKKVQNTDREDEVVPVVVRPGHIRFEPLEDSDWEKQNSVETLQWRGTTSKKKGQKWGMEKTSFQIRDFVEDSNERVASDDGVLANDPIDFEKLSPLTSSPKEGDVVAYRLVELSSSWCPELSSFRVGKISFYDSVLKRIALVPVPEYPISAKDEENETVVGPTLYNEDGSLEVDFAALVDVRIFNSEKPDPVADNTGQSNGTPMIHDSKMPHATVKENGGQPDVWEEISKALTDKKSQLLQKEDQNNTSWSYRTLRGSALGPTIAMLRAQNNLS
ncbi:coilin isoform X2 [Aristolochia californica]|uniref:coilin isoform X2 n=1 Tax=Aristolochia californica TaxID=171875 RepID=UPI0035D685FB